MHTVYIAMGTNLGDRPGNLKKVVRDLSPKVTPEALSPVYETEPWGFEEQPDFLNQVIRAETDLEPHELLVFLKDLEKQMGRQQTIRYGPRVIDLDILFYDDLVIETPELTIPHPNMAERSFVLVPLADLAPELFHPVIGKKIRDLLPGVDTSTVHLYSEASQS
ncbi:MAG: 2-amino-4-hydroxy-6-hydroxymethyldihydropteridine diphosphokinase [Chloroflexi bacterium]|nr:MAG: 2-amino-4-hydroxy-6-hydroxymethyldihydropteridine diphosphokinase [Chloroflexota bacterium]